MLLNTEIKITVTNDGNNNKIQTQADLTLTLNDVMTSIELAKKTYTDMLAAYLKSKYSDKKATEKEIKKIIKEITLQEIFDYSQQKVQFS